MYTPIHNNKKRDEGYILLMSVLVTSIILAISLGVYSLSLKEIILSNYLKNSTLAFGAADRAIECTLYWDRSAPQDGFPYTIFSTSTQYVPVIGAGTEPICDNLQLTDTTGVVTGFPTGWKVTNPTADKGLTLFSLQFPDNTCADVSVFKEGDLLNTTVISNGYNNCNQNDPRRTQRSIEVQGSF